jgi:hypothetical protein
MNNWKNNVVAKPLPPIPAPVADPSAALAGKLNLAIGEGRVSARDRNFALSLLSGYLKYGRFTPKQLPHVERLVKGAESPAPAPAPATPAQLAPTYKRLVSWFDYLTDNIAFPKLHLKVTGLGPVTIARAGNGSKTPGALNLTDGKPFGENQWYGRVNRDGTLFLRVRNEQAEELVDLLRRLEEDPKEVCAEFGLETGNCACCGRLLTNEASVELGIGPICAEKFGF